MNRFLTRPLYLQLRDALVERIASGQWKPGTVVPNEGDLAREFGVSPGTMRKALDLMEAMRLLTRRPGRGTFVNDPSSAEFTARFSDLRSANGATSSDTVNSGEIVESTANEVECLRLRLTKGDRVFRLHRRSLHNGRPYMAEDVSMPVSLFPSLADEQGPAPSVAQLAQRYGVLLGRAEERVSVRVTSLEIADALDIAFGSPVLTLDRVVFTLDGKPAEWRIAWCHLPDGHNLTGVEVMRPDGPAPREKSISEMCGRRLRTEELRCQHCKLSMKIEDHPSGSYLVYDREEWGRRCKRPDLGSPAYCLSETDIISG
jgi:GntR family transcriptional regulator